MTPREKEASLNSRPRIMASAMSVTWNSSKQRSQASCANAIAAPADEDPRSTCPPLFHLLAQGVHALVHVEHEFVEMRATLAQHRLTSKNRSISMVLPRPTSPWM